MVFPTQLGWTALCVDEQRLVGICFGRATPQAAFNDARGLGNTPTDPNQFERRLVKRLQAFAMGGEDDFLDLTLGIDDFTPFARRVIRHCRRIKYGKTLSYGELAAKAGSPRAARAVGNIMASNRFPLVVPCHRVVGAGRSLGGFSAPSGVAMKRKLLEMEGSLKQIVGEFSEGTP